MVLERGRQNPSKEAKMTGSRCGCHMALRPSVGRIAEVSERRLRALEKIRSLLASMEGLRGVTEDLIAQKVRVCNSAQFAKLRIRCVIVGSAITTVTKTYNSVPGSLHAVGPCRNQAKNLIISNDMRCVWCVRVHISH